MCWGGYGFEIDLLDNKKDLLDLETDLSDKEELHNIKDAWPLSVKNWKEQTTHRYPRL